MPTFIKPCPFCEESEDLICEDHGICNYFVKCPSCYARGSLCNSTKLAIQTWNDVAKKFASPPTATF